MLRGENRRGLDDALGAVVRLGGVRLYKNGEEECMLSNQIVTIVLEMNMPLFTGV